MDIIYALCSVAKCCDDDRLESCLKLLVKHFLNLEIKPYRFIHFLNGSILLGECKHVLLVHICTYTVFQKKHPLILLPIS